MERNIITISGPSAVGKSFFVDSIKDNFPNIREIVGLTTRPIREGEINGKSGIFMTIPEMNELEANNKLVLVKEFFGNKYAWYKDDLTNSDEYRIVNISYNSIQELLDMKLNIYSIFIKPGSEEKLKELLVIMKVWIFEIDHKIYLIEYLLIIMIIVLKKKCYQFFKVSYQKIILITNM